MFTEELCEVHRRLRRHHLGFAGKDRRVSIFTEELCEVYRGVLQHHGDLVREDRRVGRRIGVVEDGEDQSLLEQLVRG